MRVSDARSCEHLGIWYTHNATGAHRPTRGLLGRVQRSCPRQMCTALERCLSADLVNFGCVASPPALWHFPVTKHVSRDPCHHGERVGGASSSKREGKSEISKKIIPLHQTCYGITVHILLVWWIPCGQYRAVAHEKKIQPDIYPLSILFLRCSWQTGKTHILLQLHVVGR